MADKKEKKTGSLNGGDILLAVLIALIGGISAFLLILVGGSILNPDAGKSQTVDQPPAATQRGTLPSSAPAAAPTPSPSPAAEPSGEPEAEASDKSVQQTEAPSTEPAQNPAPTQGGTGGGDQGNADNFYTYDNPEQQQTSQKYVLNTSTMKFHIPSCSDVARIAPANYAASSLTREQIVNNGYSPCGHCSP